MRQSEFVCGAFIPRHPARHYIEERERSDGCCLIPAWMSVNYVGALDWHTCQRFGHQRRCIDVIRADQMKRRRRRIEQRTEHIENSADTECLTDRHDRLHRWMKMRREVKREARTRKTLARLCFIERQGQAQGANNVGTTTAARD